MLTMTGSSYDVLDTPWLRVLRNPPDALWCQLALLTVRRFSHGRWFPYLRLRGWLGIRRCQRNERLVRACCEALCIGRDRAPELMRWRLTYRLLTPAEKAAWEADRHGCRTQPMESEATTFL